MNRTSQPKPPVSTVGQSRGLDVLQLGSSFNLVTSRYLPPRVRGRGRQPRLARETRTSEEAGVRSRQANSLNAGTLLLYTVS